MSYDSWSSDRLSEGLQFKVVDEGPPRYGWTTDKAVEFYEVVAADGIVGYIWTCDADDAMGFKRRLARQTVGPNNFWNDQLRAAKDRGLTPSQAAAEFHTHSGSPFVGYLVPESKAVADSLEAVVALARAGWRDAVPPTGYRPKPPFSWGPQVAAAAEFGWLYKIDPGHDPNGQVPPYAVEGVWKLSRTGSPLGFRHNPAYGSAPAAEAAESEEARRVPPLRAGRRPAGLALFGWLDDPRAPKFCRISGSSGSGRTHLLSWLAAACPPDHPRPGRRVHVLFSAEGLTVRSATWLLADRLGLVARTPSDLMEALQDGVPRVLAVTDLDRAAAPEAIAAELLTPLLRIPWLRLLVESGPGKAADALDTAAPGGADLDLDDPRWTDPDRFAAWCAALTGTPVVADQVYPSPGLAQLAARTGTAADLDPRTPPAERAGALAMAWWIALPDELRPAIRALALAGRSLDAAQWALLPGTGGPEVVSRAAGHLPPTADGASWRLWPRQAANRIVAETRPFDADVLFRALVPRLDDGRSDLPGADPGLLGLLLHSAVGSGSADHLLADPEFLCHADPVAVTAAFEQAAVGGELAEAWDLAGPVAVATPDPAVRAAALHAWLAGRDQQSADRLGALSGRPWRAHWSSRHSSQQVFLATAGQGPLAGQLVVAFGSVYWYLDQHTGQEARPPMRRVDSEAAVLSCSEDGSLILLQQDGRIGALYESGQNGHPTRAAEALPKYVNGLTAMATYSGEGGPLQAGGDSHGEVLYHLVNGGPILRSAPPLHQGPVTGIDLTWSAGTALVVSGGRDGKVHHWTAEHGPVPVDARDCPVTAVAVADTPHGLLTAAAWQDGLVRLYQAGSVTDLRLGMAARSLVLTREGRVFLALPEGILALTTA